jgi:hypothetical protein
MQNTLSGEQLEASYQALRSVVTHPEFQSVVAEIRSLPVSERLQESLTRLTPQALAARGIPVPEGFSVITYAPAHSVNPNTHVANVATTGSRVADRCVSNDSQVCVGIANTPLRWCWNP